jgi:hypothetical protein
VSTGHRRCSAPALQRTVDGAHCFRLRRLPLLETEPTMGFVDWRHTDASGVVPFSKLEAGLYRMEEGAVRSTGVCNQIEPAATAWVLIAIPADYKRISPDWDRRSSSLRTHARRVDPDVITTVRHALLAYWADTLGKR